MKKRLSIALCLLLCLSCVACISLGETVLPELTTAQRPIPENEAMAFLKKLGVGWNLGNTFDAIKQGWNANADGMTLETAWCGVETTEGVFQALRDAGYTVVRIPVSWHDHVSGENYTISERWLSRVQQVVDWAIENDLYVILNIHHDEDQFEPSSAHYELSARYIQCIWEQLAERFSGYDEHLIFESMNEPRLMKSQYEWWFDSNAQECLDAADCLNRLNQLFVDTVRGSGGNNAERYLMVPAYDASPDNALRSSFVLPLDPADNRIIVSVHAYTPYSFALQDGGTASFGLKNQSQTSDIIRFMNGLYDRYITKGIPVVIGEFGARDKSGNLQARVDFTAFYTAAASARNLPCLWWDNSAFAGSGEIFGILDRKAKTFKYPAILDAMITYGGYDKLPVAK